MLVAINGATLSATAHGFENDAMVRLTTSGALTHKLPTPANADLIYYVVSASANAFSLAREPGGDAIVFDDDSVGDTYAENGSSAAPAVLYSDLVWWFDSQPYTVLFGWRAPSAQTYGARGRVALVPGDDGGKFGTLEPARGMASAKRQRAIYSANERVDALLYAFDPTNESDLAQYNAAWDLLELFLQGMRRSRCGRVSMGDPGWSKGPIERRLGAELRVPLLLESRVNDEDRAKAPLDSLVTSTALMIRPDIPGDPGIPLETLYIPPQP